MITTAGTRRTARLATALHTTALSTIALSSTAAAVVTVALGAGAPASAQEGLLMEEMIVTAQKRVQSQQDVPLALTVLNSDQIEASFSNNIENLQFSVPSLTFRKGTTTRNSALFLRGIGTISFSTAAEPSVSTVVDGVVFARSGMAFSDLFDVERIEVLRGPQGTLFGKNASAGVLNIVTKRPGDAFGGEFSFSAFENDEYRAKASVDVPVTDRLKARFTGFFGWFDGHITNSFASAALEGGDQINGYERQGFRGVVEWAATDNLLLTLIGDYSDAEDDCCSEPLGTPPTDDFLGPSVSAILADAPQLGNETRRVAQNLVTRTEDTNWGISLQGDLAVGDFTVTSITAFRNWDNTEIREGDFIDGTLNVILTPEVDEDTGLFTGDLVRTGGLFELHDLGPQDFETFQQELRLTSPAGGTFEYQVGVFYYNVKSDRSFTRFDRICLDSTLAPINSRDVTDADGAVAQEVLLPCVEGASTIQEPSATANFQTEFDNIAIFGQATWNITNRFRFTGGLRWTHDEVSFTHMRVNTTGGLTAPGVRAEPFDASNSTDNSNLSGKASLQYDITDDIMGYVSYARGYKGPAFNTFFNMGPNDVPPISEETSDSIEGGFKTVLFDNRLIFNIAGFYAEYDGFQANNFEVLNEVVVTRLTNAGTVSTKGLEIDFNARPIDNLTINGGLAYTDAQIEEFNVDPTAPPEEQDPRTGERLPLSPEWRLSLGGEYFIPLDTMPFDAFINSQYSYTGSQFSDLGADPNLLIDGHHLWDASVGFADKEDRYRLTFIVKNITDDSFATLITNGGPAGTRRFQIPREADRYFGINFRFNFGG